jgi:hypothetical protein
MMDRQMLNVRAGGLTMTLAGTWADRDLPFHDGAHERAGSDLRDMGFHSDQACWPHFFANAMRNGSTQPLSMDEAMSASQFGRHLTTEGVSLALDIVDPSTVQRTVWLTRPVAYVCPDEGCESPHGEFIHGFTWALDHAAEVPVVLVAVVSVEQVEDTEGLSLHSLLAIFDCICGGECGPAVDASAAHVGSLAWTYAVVRGLIGQHSPAPA